MLLLLGYLIFTKYNIAFTIAVACADWGSAWVNFDHFRLMLYLMTDDPLISLHLPGLSFVSHLDVDIAGRVVF